MVMRTRGLLTVLASLLVSPVLRAEPRGPDAPRSAAPKVPSGGDRNACSLTGTATPDLELPLTDTEGHPIARFGGVAIPLGLSELPERADGKIQVQTIGSGHLRISGFVPVQSMPIYLNQDCSIIKGHVTLLKGTRVEYAGRSGDAIRISVKTKNAIAETYHASVSCDALTLETPKPDRWSPPGQARGYLMTQPVVPLFDQPGADAKVVTSIHRAPDAGSILFFGDRREGDYIHVLYRRDVGIDGWISANDLGVLPRGELADQSATKQAAPIDKRLRMKVEGQLYKARNELPLFGKADAKSPPIGTVSRDTEIYVLDVVAGWASVLPKQLDIVPLSDKHFWVKASEIGM
jgi:hypothetical protein